MTELPKPKPAPDSDEPPPFGFQVANWIQANNSRTVAVVLLIGLTVWVAKGYSPGGRLKSTVAKFGHGPRATELNKTDRAMWSAHPEMKAGTEYAVWRTCDELTCAAYVLKLWGTDDGGSISLLMTVDLEPRVDRQFKVAFSNWWPSNATWLVHDSKWEYTRNSSEKREMTISGDLDESELNSLTEKLGSQAVANYFRAIGRNFVPLLVPNATAGLRYE